MMVGAAWLLWSFLVNAVAGVHIDGEQLRQAARREGIPMIVMEAVAAVESGYSGGNTWRGTHGEIGRMQIKIKTARGVGCGEPVRLEEYDYNIVCGAKILHWCRARYSDWSRAIRCYQAITIPEFTREYLVKVQREIGRITLAHLDLSGRQDMLAARRRGADSKLVRPPAAPQPSLSKAAGRATGTSRGPRVGVAGPVMTNSSRCREWIQLASLPTHCLP